MRKKMIALLMALSMVPALAACGSSNNTGNNTSESATEAQTGETTAAQEKWLERLARAGTLPVKWLAVAEGTPPARIAGRLPEGAYCMVALLDGEMRVKETVSETEVLRRCLKG